jgi:thiamine pyrophosphokinase
MDVRKETIVVVAGGSPPWAALPELPPGATVIAADSGVDRALALGLSVDLAIGDFDSVSTAGLSAVEAAGARVESHPAAKDATDLELALDAAIAHRPARIVAVCSDDGRLDHLLGSILLLADERYAEAVVDAYVGMTLVSVVRGERTLTGAPGDVISLLPVHGAASGVSTRGLAYPLDDETLPAGTSRGTSNVLDGVEAHVAVRHGCLLAVHAARDGGEPS